MTEARKPDANYSSNYSRCPHCGELGHTPCVDAAALAGAASVPGHNLMGARTEAWAIIRLLEPNAGEVHPAYNRILALADLQPNDDGTNLLAALIRRAQDAESHAAELDALFDLQWKRTRQAEAAWRMEAPTERDHVMPDLGALLEWLMDRAHLPLGGDEGCRRGSEGEPRCGRSPLHPFHRDGLDFDHSYWGTP